MSPTRRDILKAAGALTAALAIPQPARAVEPAVATPKIRLSMASIAFVDADESMRHLVIAQGRTQACDLGMVHFSDPPINGHYLDSTKRELTDDEVATIAAILISAGSRAFDLAGDGTKGGTR